MNDFDWSMLAWGFGGGIVVVVLTAVAAGWWVRREVALASKGRSSQPSSQTTATDDIAQPRTTLPAGAKWTFADSWASNLTALITTTAAVTAIFAKDLKDVFQRQAPLAFSLTTSLMLVVAALAPVVYAVFQSADTPSPEAAAAHEAAKARAAAAKEDPKAVPEPDKELQGTRVGWCLSAGLTLFAVGGSLVAAMRFVLDVKGVAGHHVAQSLAIIVILLMIGLVMAYVVRSFLVLRTFMKPDSRVAVSSLVGMVTISCCSGAEGTRRVRLSLL